MSHPEILENKISEIVKLCNEKIQRQFKHESTSGYYNDYDDGRIVGQAALARRILNIINTLNKLVRRWLKLDKNKPCNTYHMMNLKTF